LRFISESQSALFIISPAKHFSVCKYFSCFPAKRRGLHSNKNAIAKAIVATSISNRIIGNFFVTVNQAPAPTKLFKTEEAALKWLNKMEEKYYAKKESNIHLFI